MGRSKYDVEAAALVQAVRAKDDADGADYEEAIVRRAIVHTREDVILLCGSAASRSSR